MDIKTYDLEDELCDTSRLIDAFPEEGLYYVVLKVSKYKGWIAEATNWDSGLLLLTVKGESNGILCSKYNVRLATDKELFEAKLAGKML